MKAIINANIFDYENYIENQYILFENQIIEVGAMENYPGALYEINAKNSIVMPGFVVGHTHIYSTFARGINLSFSPKNFKDILEQLWWKIDAKLGKDEIFYSALVAGIEFLKSGVTTVFDHHASGALIRNSLNTLKEALIDNIGLRGIFCFETSDRFPVRKCIDENLEFLQNNSQMYAGIFGLHASLSLSDKTLKTIAEEYNGPIHIHVAESIDDVDYSVSNYGLTVVERLNKFGLLRKNSILAHCVHVSEKELGLISKNNCYVALNVSSNMNNAVGLPNYKKMKTFNVKTIVGNDGLGFNFARELLALLFSMKLNGHSPLAFNLNDLKNVITNTYEIAQYYLNVKLGRILPGYAADFVIVPYTPPTPIDKTNAFSHFVYGILDNFKPSHGIVNGKILMENHKINLQVNEIYSIARKIAQRLWESLI
ncbi:amidohydrolase [Thermosipho melanesiensis]|uniref:Amidohydrolase n=2 Tax=Thermosipho melanesiensis TaxID=46541 RepID=A6LJ96_THEM4|nr:amidohydrolase family protein [Thermosipho melanesiensis]ABR29997.1 amidohydrolase [Thermosipho melanesiensis BI429]APT73201.1 amidohydrolase [Thermosipho melanesiensis]OOC38595.1 amidohydrolase [Thermosipho melanesiensis]OOC40399.1 amidohydrolase [Thermosipho melanesiensis]OOC40663.1 amidohydrolase [Thermosipho melanesiensis]